MVIALAAAENRPMARTATGGHRGWLVVIASVWILAAGAGGAVLGAWVGDATCNDAEQGFGLECVVLTFTLTNESNPSPPPAFQFGPDDALP